MSNPPAPRALHAVPGAAVITHLSGTDDTEAVMKFPFSRRCAARGRCREIALTPEL
jgi:hypothetical protein